MKIETAKIHEVIMKFLKLILFFCATLATSVHAQNRVPDPIPGLYAAVQSCAKMSDDPEAIKCIQIESSANWFTAEAVSVCNEGTWDREKNQCLESIKDKWIQPSEAQTCQSQTFFSDKAQCLALITRVFPYRTTLKADPAPGLDEAGRFCQSFFFDQDKNNCIRLTGSAQYFSVHALGLCKSLFTDSEKLNCLEAIKNKVITEPENGVCASLFTDQYKQQCLKSHQRFYKTPRRPRP
jgi:hypothetical protein